MSNDFTKIKKDITERMEKSKVSLLGELSSLRTGRASTQLLDHVKVNAFGQMMPLNQVASISAPDARMLSVQVWDASNTDAVEKAILDSNLGLNPMTEGNLIRLPIPALNEERRMEMVKVAKSYTEEAKIAIRNIRRHANDELKKLQKDSVISEDELHNYQDEVQKLTDKFIAELDSALADKEKDIMTV